VTPALIDQGLKCCNGQYNNGTEAINACGTLWKGTAGQVCPDTTDCDEIKRVYCSKSDASFNASNEDTAFLVRMAETRKLDSICANKDEAWKNICACNYPLQVTITEAGLVGASNTYAGYTSYLKQYEKDYKISLSDLELLAGDPRCFYAPCHVHVPDAVREAGTTVASGCKARGFNMFQCDQNFKVDQTGNINSPVTLTNQCVVYTTDGAKTTYVKGGDTTRVDPMAKPFYSKPVVYIPAIVGGVVLLVALLYFSSSKPKSKSKSKSKSTS
jgi:hypothetical protein